MDQPKKNFKIVSSKKTRIILPNMFTLVGVCIGLSSIKFAFDGKFELSIIAILVAAIIDGLDGRIARLIKGTSPVGKELDSLTDVISFGVAPASNADPSWRDNFFEGIPSPAGGVLVLMPLVFSFSEFKFFIVNYNIIVPVLFVFISILLISKIPTYSLKKITVPRSTTIFLLLGIILYFGLLLIYTFNTIILSGVAYLIMIPVSSFHYFKIKNKFKIQSDESDEHEDVL